LRLIDCVEGLDASQLQSLVSLPIIEHKEGECVKP
jgi:hypothetical protein